jgi:hypothetical protein
MAFDRIMSTSFAQNTAECWTVTLLRFSAASQKMHLPSVRGMIIVELSAQSFVPRTRWFTGLLLSLNSFPHKHQVDNAIVGYDLYFVHFSSYLL